MRRALPLTLLLTASLFSCHSHSSGDEKTPNIVFFLADDFGWTGLRSFGSDFYETPHLDRLAAEGMK